MAQAAAAIPKAPPARAPRKFLLGQALGWFAAILGGYWLYWLVAVPLIEPGLEERPLGGASQAQIEEARGDVTARQRDVAQYFSPGDWEADKPAIWQSGDMRLLFKGLAPQSDGSVVLERCTLLFFPKGGGESAQPVIMQTANGAKVRFDEPIVLKRVDLANRKFVGGWLEGPIRIRREASAPGAGDDLEITTRDVEMTGERAWTTAPVNFRFGRSHGSGRDLEILLGPAKGERQTDVMRGATVRTLKLKRDVQMLLELGDGRLAAGAQDGRPTAAEPPIKITCQGAFEFEMQDYAASFHDNVDVFRLNPAGESDQLNCALLTVYFSRPGETPPVQNGGPPSAENRALSSHVRLIEARGDPVTMRSAARGLYARCHGVDFVPAAPGSAVPGSLAAYGPGVIHGSLPNDPAGKYDAQWARELRFEPDGPLQRATLRGATVVEIGQMGTITADEVFAWLSPKPAPPQVPVAPVALNRAPAPGTDANAWQIERVVAQRYRQPNVQSQGDVVIDGPQLHAVAETMEATIERAPQTPREAAPAADPKAQTPPPPERGRPPQNPDERFEVLGRAVHITLVPQGEELAIAGAMIERDAQLAQFSTVLGKRERSLFVKGDRLHVTDANTAATQVTIAGSPGYVEAGGMTLWGDEIHLERQTNRLWIDGPGRLTMPITQDLDGRALARPQQLAVDWKKRLDFRADTAVFTGSVVARSELERLDTDTLEAVLTGAIDFAKPVLAQGEGKKAGPELQEVRSRGPTFLVSRQLDERGEPSALSRMEVLDLSINRTSGKIAGRGPGWVKHVARGTDPPLAGPMVNAPPQRVAPAAPAKDQLTYLYITFRQGIDGNIDRREVKFFDRTRTVYGPVKDWNATLDDKNPAALGPQGMVLDAGALEVREMNRRPNSKRGWFELDASGGVFAEGQRFTALGDRLSYEEEKDQLILRGDPAEMFLENEAGGPRTETRANTVAYWLTRHYAEVTGARLNLELPGDSQKKLFDNRQPRQGAAPPR